MKVSIEQCGFYDVHVPSHLSQYFVLLSMQDDICSVFLEPNINKYQNIIHFLIFREQ